MICDLSCLEEDGVPACDCRESAGAPEKVPEPATAG